MDFIFDPSLVLYLPLYKLDGQVFADKSVYGHICTPTLTSFLSGRGRNFNGNASIDCGSNPSLDCANGLTIITWQRSSSPTTVAQMQITKQGATSYETLYYGNQGKPSLYLKTSGTAWGVCVYCTLVSPANVWEHIAFTYDASTGVGRVFRYGVEAATPSTTHSGTVGTNTNSLLIGGRAGNFAFNDDIGEVIIYNRPFTPQEIQHNYLATKWRYR